MMDVDERADSTRSCCRAVHEQVKGLLKQACEAEVALVREACQREVQKVKESLAVRSRPHSSTKQKVKQSLAAHSSIKKRRKVADTTARRDAAQQVLERQRETACEERLARPTSVVEALIPFNPPKWAFKRKTPMELALGRKRCPRVRVGVVLLCSVAGGGLVGRRG